MLKITTQSPNTYFEYFDKTVAIHCPEYLHTKLDNKLFEISIDWDKYELHFKFSGYFWPKILPGRDEMRTNPSVDDNLITAGAGGYFI